MFAALLLQVQADQPLAVARVRIEVPEPDVLLAAHHLVHRHVGVPARHALDLDAAGALRHRLEQQSAAYDSILKKLAVLYTKGLLDIEVSPEVYLEGASNLVGLDLHLTREKMRELFRALEEKKRILHLLDRFLEQSGGEVMVQVGLGEAHPSMRELSLIGVAVALNGGVCAKIAVLGPMRMNYEKAISAVLHMGQAFQSVSA